MEETCNPDGFRITTIILIKGSGILSYIPLISSICIINVKILMSKGMCLTSASLIFSDSSFKLNRCVILLFIKPVYHFIGSGT